MAPRLFIKVFFGAGIPFGLIMGLIQWPGLGGSFALKIGLKSGAGFGLIVSVIACSIHFIITRKAGLCGTSEKAAFSQTLDLPVMPGRTFDLVLEGLSRIKNCEVSLEDRETGRIEAQAGQTWKSWGEEIRVDIRPTDSGTTRVTLASRSGVRTTLVDFGKNQENVQAIVSAFPEV